VKSRAISTYLLCLTLLDKLVQIKFVVYLLVIVCLFVCLFQYSNPSNPLAHYDGTAEEILESCDGELFTEIFAIFDIQDNVSFFVDSTHTRIKSRSVILFLILMGIQIVSVNMCQISVIIAIVEVISYYLISFTLYYNKNLYSAPISTKCSPAQLRSHSNKNESK